MTDRKRDVAEVIDGFEADWHRQAFTPRMHSHLIWCPGPGRDRICDFIDDARHRLFVQNERYQDAVIIERLVRAQLRGKMLLADGVAAIVGSINFAAGSFDDRRELAIEVRDDDIIDRLYRTAHHDWEHSHPLDLSDAGLLSDLEDRIEDSAQLLGLD